MMGLPPVARGADDDAKNAAASTTTTVTSTSTSTAIDDGAEEERSAKRPRLESLVPAEQWAVTVPSVRVRFAVVDDSTKRHWQLNGQTLELEFDSTTLVSQVKAKLSSLLGDFPPNKQKLQSDRVGVLKDDFSLAKYNFSADNETVHVGVKGRGTKK